MAKRSKGFILLVFLLAGCGTVPVKSTVKPFLPVVPKSVDYHLLRKPSPEHVRLAFVGDINLSRHVETLLDQKGKKWILESCKPLFDDSDLVVANLESSVGEGNTPYTKKSVYLKGRVDSLDALAYAGLGLVTLANNHILDYGPDVMKQTIQGLDQRGILHTGLVGLDNNSDNAVYVQVQGLILAFLGYCSVCPGAFESKDGKPGVGVALAKVMALDVKIAKSKADFVIVLVHWGQEYYGANALQKRLAQALSEAGADLVIGAHPHVLQKVERKGRTLVAYSLGNFVFDLHYPVCQDSCVLYVDLQKGNLPKWNAVALNLSSGRPEPLGPETIQAKRIQRILKKGYEYNGRKKYD